VAGEWPAAAVGVPLKGGGGGLPDFTAETWILTALAIAAAIIRFERLRLSSRRRHVGRWQILVTAAIVALSFLVNLET
jgi:hypothetical protein